MNTRFFFYGTLMSGHFRSHALNGLAHPVSPALTRGRLYDTGGFPALTDDGCNLIVGEVWEVNDEALVPECLRILDMIESYREGDPERSMYLREKRDLVAPDCAAWVYIWNYETHGLRVIESGDWRGYSARKRVMA